MMMLKDQDLGLTRGMTSYGVMGLSASKYWQEKLWKSQLPVSPSIGPDCMHSNMLSLTHSLMYATLLFPKGQICAGVSSGMRLCTACMSDLYAVPVHINVLMNENEIDNGVGQQPRHHKRQKGNSCTYLNAFSSSSVKTVFISAFIL